jgi:hypothetical protein
MWGRKLLISHKMGSAENRQEGETTNYTLPLLVFIITHFSAPCKNRTSVLEASVINMTIHISYYLVLYV